MAFLAPLALAAGTGALGALGSRAGSKIAEKLGFKKGGSHNPKAMTAALNRATVKKTGVRHVGKNELVVPVGLAKKLKQVARRKPQPVKRKCKCKKKGKHR